MNLCLSIVLALMTLTVNSVNFVSKEFHYVGTYILIGSDLHHNFDFDLLVNISQCLIRLHIHD